MALKINELNHDAAGVMSASGQFDGEPFSFSAIGRKWLLKLSNGLTVEQDADNVASRGEARGALYGAVAMIRARQRVSHA